MNFRTIKIYMMRHTVVILLLVGFGPFGCNAQPTNSLSELYKNTDIHYSYDEASQTHDYSGNWDFDGDGIADKLLFVGNGGAHLQFWPTFYLSSNDSVFSFPSLPTDMPIYEPSYPPKLGFSTVDYHQGDGSDIPHIVLNVPARQELVMLSYDDFFLDMGMKTNQCPVLTFSDGDSAILLEKLWGYDSIDSISVSTHSFEALYLSCGKGNFNFQEQDLAFIKDEALREEIAYYYVIRDFEENMPAEPTAVLLSQGGKELYITTVERVKNSCRLPKDTPVTCKAYLFSVFTKEGLFNEVVVYDIKPRKR